MHKVLGLNVRYWRYLFVALFYGALASGITVLIIWALCILSTGS